MTKKDSIELLSKIIELVQGLEAFRLCSERKALKEFPVPLATIERMLLQSRQLYDEMSRYFVTAKSMPKERGMACALRNSQMRVNLLIRENWRLEERIEKLRKKLEDTENFHPPRPPSGKGKKPKKEDDQPSLFHCA